MPNSGGPRSSRRKLYAHVVDTILLYGAPIWSTAAQKRAYIRQAESAHRRACLRVIGGRPHVSYEATYVLAGIPPLALLADERARLYSRRREDAKDEERLATLSKWQEAWDRSTKARWTHRLIPNIRTWIERRHGELNYHLTQLLTGQGFFKHHSQRYDHNQSAQCPVCPTSIENAEHVFLHCPRFSGERERDYMPYCTRRIFEVRFSPGVVEPVPEVEQVPLEKKTLAMSSASEAVKKTPITVRAGSERITISRSPRRGLTKLAIDGAQHSHDEVRSEKHTHKRAPDAGAKAQLERMMAPEARTTLTRWICTGPHSLERHVRQDPKAQAPEARKNREVCGRHCSHSGGQAPYLVEFYSNETIRLVRAALTDLGLQTADQKTEVLFFTSRNVRETINLRAGDQYITSAPYIQYLGVHIDARLRFDEHLRIVSDKANRVAGALLGLMPNIGGPRSSRRKLYASVVDSILLYGAVASIHRRACLRVICRFRIISHEASYVLSSIPPLHRWNYS
ncbi:unnamed protein product [Trichogramma brassicae]|uniref:Reverse transcriptase zinc-binding domain-containing protein n=1 Tax=Trichogramma brassicae TaxID=86971 RepID=A0A6H5IRG2_9HYME|nr:unnamed protein product [Trichogramma brassicae]